jgi:NitT/TauT family transport system permease protein
MKVRILQLVTVIAALGAWELIARLGWVDPLFVPAPSAVASALVSISRGALAGLADTLGKTAVAYVLSVVLGVSAGLAVGSVRLLRDVLSPYVIALYGIPKILVLPWIVLLLGYGTTPAVFYGVLHGFFPIMVLVMGAVRDVDRTLVTVARSLGATTGSFTGRCSCRRSSPRCSAGCVSASCSACSASWSSRCSPGSAGWATF